MRIKKINVESLIEFQSGEYNKNKVLEAFRMFDNKPEEVIKWIDQLLFAWQIEERNGYYFWIYAD